MVIFQSSNLALYRVDLSAEDLILLDDKVTEYNKNPRSPSKTEVRRVNVPIQGSEGKKLKIFAHINPREKGEEEQAMRDRARVVFKYSMGKQWREIADGEELRHFDESSILFRPQFIDTILWGSRTRSSEWTHLTAGYHEQFIQAVGVQAKREKDIGAAIREGFARKPDSTLKNLHNDLVYLSRVQEICARFDPELGTGPVMEPLRRTIDGYPQMGIEGRMRVRKERF